MARIIERLEAKTEKELNKLMANYREQYPYMYGVEVSRRGTVKPPGSKKAIQHFAVMSRYASG